MKNYWFVLLLLLCSSCSDESMKYVNTVSLIEMTRNGESRELFPEDEEPIFFVYDNNLNIQRWKGDGGDIDVLYLLNNQTIEIDWIGKYKLTFNGDHQVIEAKCIYSDPRYSGWSYTETYSFVYESNNLVYVKKMREYDNDERSNKYIYMKLVWDNGNITKITMDGEYENSCVKNILDIAYTPYKNCQNFSMSKSLLFNFLDGDIDYCMNALALAGLLGNDTKNHMADIFISEEKNNDGDKESYSAHFIYEFNKDHSIKTETIEMKDENYRTGKFEYTYYKKDNL